MNARNGTDQLTKTLNGYMQALVNEIITNDGDVLKFAGKYLLTCATAHICFAYQVINVQVMQYSVSGR